MFYRTIENLENWEKTKEKNAITCISPLRGDHCHHVGIYPLIVFPRPVCMDFFNQIRIILGFFLLFILNIQLESIQKNREVSPAHELPRAPGCRAGGGNRSEVSAQVGHHVCMLGAKGPSPGAASGLDDHHCPTS